MKTQLMNGQSSKVAAFKQCTAHAICFGIKYRSAIFLQAQAASHAASLSASGGKSLNNSGMLSDSIPGGSSIKVRAFSNLGPHAGKLPPLNRSRQQSVMDGEDALDKSIQVSVHWLDYKPSRLQPKSKS